jgi:protein SCO1
MNTRRHLLLAAAALPLAPLAACDSAKPPPPPFKSIDITGATYARTLELPDTSGKARTLADFKGKVPIVFFGYTQCPDVCPTTMAEIAEARAKLGKAGADVLPVFITIDPERDSAEILKAYVGTFAPDAVALRGTLDQTRAAAKEFKVFFAKAPSRTPDSYTMDHTAGSFVFDRKGHVRLFVRNGAGVDVLASDLKILLEGA